MADIFLSYARADQPRVEKLSAALEEAGYSVWWDKHVRGGHRFSEDIEAAIAKAKAVLVVWSKDAVKSEWVRDEAAYGRDHDKLVPVRIDDTLPPMGYRQRHAIDLDDPGAMTALTEALDAYVGGQHETNADIGASKWRTSGIVLIMMALLAGVVGVAYLASRDQPNSQAGLTEPNEVRETIAVLPFVAQSSDKDDQYFADGVTEEILNRLDALNEFRVLPRTTVFSLRDEQDDLETLTRRLNVDYVVEGSLRRSGDTVRVSARLVRASDAQTLWSNSYNGARDQILQFQSDIAAKVAGSLDVLLNEVTLRRMEAAGINDPEAFALYAEATEKFSDAHTDLKDLRALLEATRIYDQAFALAPKLVAAQVNASDLYSHILLDSTVGHMHPELPPEVLANPQEELQRRLALARTNATSEQERVMIELYATAFSSDWSRIPALSREAHRWATSCTLPNWNTFLMGSFADTGYIADAYFGQQDCYVGDEFRSFNLAWEMGRAGRISDMKPFIAKQMAIGFDMHDSRSVVAIFEGRGGDALDIAKQGGQPVQLQTARAFLGEEIEKVRSYLQQDGVPVYEKIAFYAMIGDRDETNRLARMIDARPGGPTALQIASDFCLCGKPWDIENTPNYAAMLAQTGFSWPPRDYIDWPLKDW